MINLKYYIVGESSQTATSSVSTVYSFSHFMHIALRTDLKRSRKWRKIPIINPGLIIVQKAFLVGLFSGELIFGGAYYWREFYVSKWVGLDTKNS